MENNYNTDARYNGTLHGYCTHANTAGYPNNVAPQYIPTDPNGMYQQYQSNMPKQFQMNSNTAEYLFKQTVVANRNAQIEFNKMSLHHQFKMEEEAYKAHIAEKREESNFRRKINRENAVTAIIEDAGGYLCVQIKFPDGNSSYSDPIFKYANIHLTRILAKKSDEEINIIRWQDGNKEKGFVLKGAKCNSKHLMKEMEKQGNPILVSRDRKKQIADLVYGFLVDHGNTVRIPEHYGWNKEGDSWFFADERQFTIERYEKGESI